MMMKLKLYVALGVLTVFLSCQDRPLDASKSNRLALNTNVERIVDPAEEYVEEWPAYKRFERNMRTLSNTNPLNALGLMDRMAQNINAMPLQVPEALETPKILDKIDEIDAEVNTFYAEVDRTEMRERIVRRHISEILNAFDALNREINATVRQRMM